MRSFAWKCRRGTGFRRGAPKWEVEGPTAPTTRWVHGDLMRPSNAVGHLWPCPDERYRRGVHHGSREAPEAPTTMAMLKKKLPPPPRAHTRSLPAARTAEPARSLPRSGFFSSPPLPQPHCPHARPLSLAALGELTTFRPATNGPCVVRHPAFAVVGGGANPPGPRIFGSGFYIYMT
jgi:hypothetical protein